MEVIRLAVSWLTVLPVHAPDTVDRRVAGRAIALAPVAGVLLGAGAAGVLWVLERLGAPPGSAGLAAVAGVALMTRGMHLDGLADTMDGLGSYAPPERAREIMKSGGSGPFGVVALIFAVGMQALSFGALAVSGRWAAVVVAVAVGRVGVVLACRRGIMSAPGAGFGPLVAGTQTPLTVAAWGGTAVVAAGFTVPHHWWLGPLAVLLGLFTAVLMVHHCVRRFGGLNGDVLGAALELAVTVTAVTISLRP